MNEFKRYHPIVNFVYFLFVIGFGCLFMHPVCLGISLVSGFICSVMLKGVRAIKTNLIYMLPVVIGMALINPVFNHEGLTIVAYLPDGNPLTAEAMIYGICTALMIVSVICHFFCFNRVMTSDKFIYLFGRIMPSLSLVVSMTFRFVPRFSAQLKEIANAQKCMGQSVSEGSICRRARSGLNILSVLTTMSLENSIETADSMKSRGYGIPGRTTFSLFSFDKRDWYILVFMVLAAAYVIAGYVSGAIGFEFFPSIKAPEVTVYGISVYLVYFLLCMCPVIIELWEVIRWSALKSRI